MTIKNYCKLLLGFKLNHSSAIIATLIVLFALLSNKAHLAVEEWMPHICSCSFRVYCWHFGPRFFLFPTKHATQLCRQQLLAGKIHVTGGMTSYQCRAYNVLSTVLVGKAWHWSRAKPLVCLPVIRCQIFWWHSCFIPHRYSLCALRLHWDPRNSCVY